MKWTTYLTILILTACKSGGSGDGNTVNPNPTAGLNYQGACRYRASDTNQTLICFEMYSSTTEDPDQLEGSCEEDEPMGVYGTFSRLGTCDSYTTLRRSCEGTFLKSPHKAVIQTAFYNDYDFYGIDADFICSDLEFALTGTNFESL